MSETQKHTKPNVPNLRFPGFEGEWERLRLEEIAEYRKERITTSHLTTGTYVSTENMLPGYGGITSAPSIPAINSASAFFPGDILLSNIRPYLKKVWQANKHGGCSSDVMVIKPAKKLCDRFLYYVIANDSFINYAMAGAKGVKMPRGDKAQLMKYEFALPGFAEQKKMVSLLSLLDQRITIQSKVIEDLQTLKKAITAQLILSSEGEKKTLGDITEVFSIRNKDKIKYPLFSVTNDKGFIPQSEQFEEREMEGDDISAYKLINTGDIAYNPARINVGSIAQYKGDKTCMISSLYVCVKTKAGVSSRWLMHVLKSNYLLFYYNLYAEGGVRQYLFYPNFSRIRIILPSASKQDQIANGLDAIDEKLKNESRILNTLLKQKEYMLKQMFV